MRHPPSAVELRDERLAAKLAKEESRRIGAVRSLAFGAYLTSQWLPAKKLHLPTSTYRGYERNAHLHVVPALGRIGLRRLGYQQIESHLSRSTSAPPPSAPASGTPRHDQLAPRDFA